jgi:hypothetical protein
MASGWALIDCPTLWSVVLKLLKGDSFGEGIGCVR